MKRTLGGNMGYSAGKNSSSLNTPSVFWLWSKKSRWGKLAKIFAQLFFPRKTKKKVHKDTIRAGVHDNKVVKKCMKINEKIMRKT
jgi:hypothetical protein